MEEKIGIENLKDVAKSVIELVEDIDEKKEGGITVGEGISIAVNTVDDVYRIARKGEEIKKEWKDRDEEERVELVEFIVDEFDLENEEAEKITEQALKVAKETDVLFVYVQEARAARKAREEEDAD